MAITIYLIGVILSIISGITQSFNAFPQLYIAEESFKEFYTLWYKDFDKQWEGVKSSRRYILGMVVTTCFGSYITLIGQYIIYKKIRFTINIPKMPDKEVFRLHVETTRLIDPLWGTSKATNYLRGSKL